MTQEQKQVLDKLESGRICEFEPTDSGGVLIGECCDDFFSQELSRDELGHLIDYLKSIYEQYTRSEVV